MLMIADRWEGAREVGEERDGVSDADVTEAIAALDGKTHTEVCLVSATGTQLTVAGGRSHLLVTYFDPDNGGAWQLVDPQAGQGQVRIMAGGQAGDFDRKFAVGTEQAHDAIAAFLRDGSRIGAHWHSAY